MAPEWANEIFSERPGSFSHFYHEMSFSNLLIEGTVAPSRYASSRVADAYLAATNIEPGKFGQFSQEVLSQADHDIDFTRFDNDGPDGIPNSGDDDGVVDAVFLVTASAPPNFILGNATGIASLGLTSDFSTDDVGADNRPIRIVSHRGSDMTRRAVHRGRGV